MYAPVYVDVTASDPENDLFTFKAVDKDGNISTYTDIAWAGNHNGGGLWVNAPSTLPTCNQTINGEPGDVPGVGDDGNLYMTAAFCDNQNPPIKYSTPKWPGNLPGTPQFPFEAIAGKLVLEGLELQTPDRRKISIDLANLANAPRPFTLTVDSSGRVTGLNLTADGFANLGLAVPVPSLDTRVKEAAHLLKELGGSEGLSKALKLRGIEEQDNDEELFDPDTKNELGKLRHDIDAGLAG